MIKTLTRFVLISSWESSNIIVWPTHTRKNMHKYSRQTDGLWMRDLWMEVGSCCTCAD